MTSVYLFIKTPISDIHWRRDLFLITYVTLLFIVSTHTLPLINWTLVFYFDTCISWRHLKLELFVSSTNRGDRVNMWFCRDACRLQRQLSTRTAEVWARAQTTSTSSDNGVITFRGLSGTTCNLYRQIEKVIFTRKSPYVIRK